jgi:glycosidase
MHIILEFIPNHTSNISMWFTQSVENPKSKYGDYYIWKGSNRKGVDGEPLPPNDWVRFNCEVEQNWV